MEQLEKQKLAINKYVLILLRDSVILLGSLVVASYFYGIFTFGIDQLEIYLQDFSTGSSIVIVTVLSIFIINLIVSKVSDKWHMVRFREQFFALLLSITISAFGMLLIDYNVLQMAVFASISLFIAFCFTIWADVNPIPSSNSGSGLLNSLMGMWHQRYLILLWAKYNLQSRYIESRLGTFWIVLQPIITAIVYTIVFTIIFNRPFRQDVPFTSFFLTGIIYWELLTTSIMEGVNAVLKERNILKQLQVPIEILIVINFVTILVNFFVMFTVMIVINMFFGIMPSIEFIFILPILAIQVFLSLGIMFMAGSISVFSRDIPQLISSVMRLLFYFSAILYPLRAAPNSLQALLMLNPMALLIDNFRSIIIVGQRPNFIELIYPLMVAITLFFAGFRFLKANEKRFVDML